MALGMGKNGQSFLQSALLNALVQPCHGLGRVSLAEQRMPCVLHAAGCRTLRSQAATYQGCSNMLLACSCQFQVCAAHSGACDAMNSSISSSVSASRLDSRGVTVHLHSLLSLSPVDFTAESLVSYFVFKR